MQDSKEAFGLYLTIIITIIKTLFFIHFSIDCIVFCLEKMITNEALTGVPLLIVANKQDIPVIHCLHSFNFNLNSIQNKLNLLSFVGFVIITKN
jgi:hypothetical protein